LLIGCSAICNAQEKQSHTTKVKFTPPVIVKNEASKGKKQKRKEEVKFTPSYFKR
jgi:hypothetical protein